VDVVRRGARRVRSRGDNGRCQWKFGARIRSRAQARRPFEGTRFAFTLSALSAFGLLNLCQLIVFEDCLRNQVVHVAARDIVRFKPFVPQIVEVGA
jgi:hypothetical protein